MVVHIHLLFYLDSRYNFHYWFLSMYNIDVKVKTINTEVDIINAKEQLVS